MQNATTVVSRLLILGALASGASWAQPGNIEFKITADNMDGQAVTGKPYTATAVTNSVQTLSDGTKITRNVQVSLARDSEGRTRREQSASSMGPFTGNAKGMMVSIKDPVAQTHYTLEPDGQTAVKSPIEKTFFFTAGAQSMTVTQTMVQAKRMAELKMQDGVRTGTSIMLSPDGPNVAYSISRDGGAKAQTEDLGVKVIEGVNAKGHRETRTIPVGEIGNDHPIQVVSEVWYSDDLQTIVYSKHSDPRVGESEYKLTNISRVEPARSLFEIPAGYTVRDEGHRE